MIIYCPTNYSIKLKETQIRAWIWRLFSKVYMPWPNSTSYKNMNMSTSSFTVMNHEPSIFPVSTNGEPSFSTGIYCVATKSLRTNKSQIGPLRKLSRIMPYVTKPITHAPYDTWCSTQFYLIHNDQSAALLQRKVKFYSVSVFSFVMHYSFVITTAT